MLNELQRLEDKIIGLVDELEKLRGENQQLRAESGELKQQSTNENEKLRGILSLLEGVETQGA